MFKRRMVQRSAAVAVALLLTLSPLLALAYNWTQFDGGPSHTGNNTQEGQITTHNVNRLSQLFQVSLPSTADGAPAFLSSASSPMSGTIDIVYLTTKGGHTLALDARTGGTVWSHRPATSPNYTTSSPAIDPSGQFVYSYGLEGKVHKYAVGSGAEVDTDGWPQLATLKPNVEKGSAALSIATARSGTSYLYVANGGYPGDAGDYQGHITTINLATGAQKVFNASCSNLTVHFVENGTPPNDCPDHPQNAIWARPGVVYDPDTDRIYMTTGNGDYDGNAGGYNWGDTIFALNPDGSGANGKPLDSYTPSNYQQLQNQDLDLGSTNLVILHAPAGSVYQHIAAQSGKEGKIHLINLDNMSGQGGVGHTGGELQKIDVPQGGEVLPSPATWVNPADGSTWLFVGNGSGIAGIQVTLSGNTPQLTPRWHHGPSSSSPLVVNGVLFYASDNNIYALDPTSGNQLWSSNLIAGIHWESPVVANGALYITDEDGKLTAFTIDAQPPCAASFSDVSPNNIFHGAIYYLACHNIVNGTSPGRYSPAAAASRAEFAKMVVLGFGVAPYTPGAPDFTDVLPFYFAYQYIEAGFHAGIFGGYNQASCQAHGANFPCFLPNLDISRAEITAFVVRAAGYTITTPGSPTFNDVPPSYFAYSYIETAAAKNVVNGYPDGSFRPNTSTRRDELASILYKAITTP